MSTFQVVQAVIIGLVVVVSAYVAFRKLLPKTSMRVMGRLAASLNRKSRAAPVRALGRALQPAQATGSCGDGCGSCGGCGPSPQINSPSQPLTFTDRR